MQKLLKLKLIKILLISIFLINGVSINIYAEQYVQPVSEDCSSYKLNDLVDNFQNYKTTNIRFHEGDLYQHSIWTSLAVDQWFESHESWVGGLTERDRELAVLAALLHDVGKAGDLDFIFHTKSDHEIKGLEYLMSIKPFHLTQHKTFDFVKFFKSLGISEDDIKTISILVGCHNLLGELLTKLPEKINELDDLSEFRPAVQDFFVQIHNVICLVDCNKKLDPSLLKLIILICLADVKGSNRVDLNKPLKIFDFIIKSSPDLTHPICLDNFIKFGYDSRGPKICEFLLGFEK